MTQILKHILIADDDLDDIELFQAAIDETYPGTKLTTANDGLKLMNILGNISKPDVIVLDLNMPRMSGRECLDEIRSKDQFHNIPIVILSTSSIPSEIESCLSNGANHYFVKPQSYDKMKLIVSSIISYTT